ncbi:hypothetical protein SCHPADRAFT_915059 [Schizopora paradoxa]|uniref:Uncharacterized protein n=1 Tax=Schizopora paradoxa TaxID=27342 RepID=A0A0H2RQA3_9AGAM|nr:hypothetical protein SCHPADRAFT_915059 [Schizopora paradoxa]
MSSSSSPPLRRRLSDASSREELINAFEAEEERIINVLSRKLEQLQRDKVLLERVHEEESESQVNRLTRELFALKRRVRAQEEGENGGGGGPSGASSNGASVPSSSRASVTIASPTSPAEEVDPSSAVLLAALRKENESLRTRLVVAEREYVRVRRLNEVYREELIEHRRRLGLSVDNLIGLESSNDALSQPLHRRSFSGASSSSPTASMVALPSGVPAPRVSTTHSMPIPRASAQPHRANHFKPAPSIPQTPLSHSPSSSLDSANLFSPILSSAHRRHEPSSSYVSTQTTLTTPNSTSSLQTHPPAPYGQEGAPGGGGGGAPILTYPSVPPPSLSSSLGSPTISYYIGTREPPSPVDEYVLGRRDSLSHTGSMNGVNGSGGRRVVESGSLRDLPRSRRTSVERGGRIAETGTLGIAGGGGRNGNGSGSATTGNVSDSPVLGAFVPSLNETIE